MKRNIWIGAGIVAVVLITLVAISQSSTFTVYPVQCNDWLKTPPATADFSNCNQPEALARQTFTADTSKNQVIETSPDNSDVVQLNSCTIQDGQHWSCGQGGIVAASQTSRSGSNFNEYGLTGVAFVTETQWNSINAGKPSTGYGF
jgi:hypothetical protein